MKKSEIKRLDDLWSILVKTPGYCLHCGRNDRKLEAAHIVGRSAYSTRWRLDNGLCLCFTCHQDYDQHRNNMETWVREYITQEKWDELQTAGNIVGKKYFYDEVRATLKT